MDGQFIIERYLGSDEEVEATEVVEVKHNGTTYGDNDNSSINANDGDICRLDYNDTNFSVTHESDEEHEDTCKKIKNVDNYFKVTSVDESAISRKAKKKKHINKDLACATPGSDEGLDTNKPKRKKKKPNETVANNYVSLTEDNIGDKELNDQSIFPIIGKKRSKTVEKRSSTLPKWLSNPSLIGIDLQNKKVPVEELNYLDSFSKNNLKVSGIHFLFPVQQSVIPWLMQADQLISRPSDLCVSAPTGSGKTLAFVIPIVQSLKSRVVCAIRAVVVLPVSELAIQVYKVFETFVGGTDLKVVLLTGQKSFKAEQNALVRRGFRTTQSLADIIVTTPGRVFDHIQKTDGFTLQHLRYLVVDEADRMMDDFQKGWLKRIESEVYKESCSLSCQCFSSESKRFSSMPFNVCKLQAFNPPLQKLLYSATLSHDPEKLHTLSLYRPKLFITNDGPDNWIGKCPLPENLVLEQIICEAQIKPMVLCHYIHKNGFKKVLCFTESVERSQRLTCILEQMGGVESREISSNFRPVQRKIVLSQFNSGKVNLLVCSDIVARGIDIDGVDCVVSYDAPPFLKTFIHRVGRTARANKKGTALILIAEAESKNFKSMLTEAEISLPTQVSISAQDLKVYEESFKKALPLADAKIRQLKKSQKRKSMKKQTTPC